MKFRIRTVRDVYNVLKARDLVRSLTHGGQRGFRERVAEFLKQRGGEWRLRDALNALADFANHLADAECLVEDASD